MQASIENLEGLKRLMTVTVPAEDIKKIYSALIRDCGRNARIPGFRKGHIPTKILESYYGTSLLSQLFDKAVNSSIKDALKQCGVDMPATETPEISIVSQINGHSDLTYTASFEVNPVVEAKPLNELKLKLYNSAISDADIDRMVENIRSQQAKWQVNDGADAQDGRLVKIDFVGRVDGQEFPNGSAQDFSLLMGSNSMIPGFAEGIVGHKAGEKFTINVTFPEDYHEESLKGKPAEFDITVNSVSERILPELNSDFFALFTAEKDATEESFRAALRKNMEREQKSAQMTRDRGTIFEDLLKLYGEFAVPASMVEACRHDICERNVKAQAFRYAQNNVDDLIKDMLKDPEAFKEAALRESRLYFIAQAYIAQSGLQGPSEDSINEQIALIADAYEDPEEVKRELKKTPEYLKGVRDRAFERDLINYIKSNAQCEYADISFSQLMGFDPLPADEAAENTQQA